MIAAIAGASGSGKSTLIQALREDFDNTLPLPSYTTRPKRDSDVAGELAHVSDEEFDRQEKAGEFIWTVSPFGSSYRYGTRIEDVDTALKDEEHVYLAVLTVDVLPTLHKRQSRFEDLCLMYLMIRDAAELERRLRADAPRTDIDGRLKAMVHENAVAERLAMRLGMHVLDATLPKEVLFDRAVLYINLRAPLEDKDPL